jgi:hypothetical protein
MRRCRILENETRDASIGKRGMDRDFKTLHCDPSRKRASGWSSAAGIRVSKTSNPSSHARTFSSPMNLQHPRWLHHRHLQRQQLVIESEELRDAEGANLDDARLFQPFINLLLAQIRFLHVVNFQRGDAGMSIAFLFECFQPASSPSSLSLRATRLQVPDLDITTLKFCVLCRLDPSCGTPGSGNVNGQPPRYVLPVGCS